MARYYNLLDEDGITIANYPGTTSILGEFINKADGLLRWKANQIISHIKDGLDNGRTIEDMIENTKREVSDAQEETMDIGTQVHSAIESYIKGEKGGSIIDDERVYNGYMAFLDWEKDNVKRWLHSEKVVYSNEYKYAGSIDAIAIMKEKAFIYKDPKKAPRIDRKEDSIYVIDFKTSNNFYDDMKLQLSAYASAYMEMGLENGHEVDMDGIGILRLDKETGIPEWRDYTKHFVDSTIVFRHLVQAFWKYKKRKQLPGGPIKNFKEWKYVK